MINDINSKIINELSKTTFLEKYYEFLPNNLENFKFILKELSNIDLSDISFENADLLNSNLSNANLFSANLMNSNLINLKFNNVDLSKTRFDEKTIWKKADLRCAILPLNFKKWIKLNFPDAILL